MSAPVAPGNSGTTSRRTVACCILLCLVVLPLAQAALGYCAQRTSWPWVWLAGTPIAYLLIGGLGAFGAAGGLATAPARERGALLGSIGGVGGAAVAALVTAAIILRALHTPQPPLSHLGPSGPAFLGLLVLFVFVPAFVGVNLLGITLATLGGLLGGTLRAIMRRRAGARPTREFPAPPERARLWIVAMVIALTLSILAGIAALVLSSGAFPAIR
jgi:hypothetical protein